MLQDNYYWECICCKIHHTGNVLTGSVVTIPIVFFLLCIRLVELLELGEFN